MVKLFIKSVLIGTGVGFIAAMILRYAVMAAYERQMRARGLWIESKPS